METIIELLAEAARRHDRRPALSGCSPSLPLSHAFEQTCGFLTPLLAGASVVYPVSARGRSAA